MYGMRDSRGCAEIAEAVLRGGRDEYGCGAVIEGRWCLVKSDGKHCTGCGW